MLETVLHTCTPAGKFTEISGAFSERFRFLHTCNVQRNKFSPDGAGEIIIATLKQEATTCSSGKELLQCLQFLYTPAILAYQLVCINRKADQDAANVVGTWLAAF